MQRLLLGWLLAGPLVGLLGISSQASAAEVVTFDALPFAEGTAYANFYNGDPSAPSSLRSNFVETGVSFPFGESFPQTDQRWTSGPIAFSNGYISSFDSWVGWSWSRVQDPTTPGVGNQYASITGGGSDGNGNVPVTGTYAVVSGASAVSPDPGRTPHPYFNVAPGYRLGTIEITNTTYAALSMLSGDTFAKRFGGDLRSDPDFFSVTLTGYDGGDATGNVIGTVEHFLADFRFADNGLDYVLEGWEMIDLAPIAAARSVALTFRSSDTSTFGDSEFINTPVYAAFDNLTVTAIPEASQFAWLSLAAGLWAVGRRRKQFFTKS